MNKRKIFCIRLDRELHMRIKVLAYSEGKTMQEWVMDLIHQKLKEKRNASEYFTQ